MRKAQKAEVLEFIRSLYQAHEEIKAAIAQNNADAARNMISECQEFAVMLGESVERLEEEGHAAIACIEEYCEVLFQVFQELENNSANKNKAYKTLKSALFKVENSARNDIRVRKEIVFFPYKASMWDSLESIYLAAREDKDCDAYCVPIPYYDLNVDQSLGEMHYEGAEYPKNIEVIDWRTYRFEERRPDAIYIHNPYDDLGYVTRVDPRFYSENLKKYTDCLVYVPYFVWGDIDPENKKAVAKIKHYCFSPGIINADRVIVESEDMKKVYVSEYIKAAKEYGHTGEHLDRKHQNKKILGLGSPKYDKLITTEKENLKIPKDWLKIIEKADGTWKKIILYNTGVAELIRCEEKWVDKIEHSMRIFRECQGEAALLWRPHPFVESTMRTIVPQALERYLELKNKYLEEAWGIYDDTADMNRAIAISDAYYGDSGSVMQLYKKTGKIMMIQEINYFADFDDRYILETSKKPVLYERWGIGLFNFIEFATKCKRSPSNGNVALCGKTIYEALTYGKMQLEY